MAIELFQRAPDRRSHALDLLAVSHSGDLGGAELALVEVLDAVRRHAGLRVGVAVPHDGALRSRLASVDIASFVTPVVPWVHDNHLGRRAVVSRAAAARLRHAATVHNAAATLARALPPLDPAVVMSNTLASPVGALAARHAGRPHLWFAHELVSGAHTLAFDLPRSSALAMVGRLSSAVAVNSSWLAAQLGPSVGIPTRVVPLVVPVVDRPAHHHGAAKLRLVMVARLVAGKGHALVMDAVGLARRDGLDVELTLVGDGPVAMTRALVAHLRRLGLSDVVHFAGHQRDVTAFLDDADVAVVASTDEALGRATIEAMKRGVAVVGLGAGGTTELLADGRGWCVGPGQGADRRLAAALREARDPASRRVRAARAQAYALGCFSEEAAATGLLAALELAWVRAACATG